MAHYLYYTSASGSNKFTAKKVGWNGSTFRKVGYKGTVFILSTLSGATCTNCVLKRETKSTRNKYGYQVVYTYRMSEDGTYKNFGGTHTTYTITQTFSQTQTRLVTDDSQFHRTICFTLIGHPTQQQVVTGTETYVKGSENVNVPDFSVTCSVSGFSEAMNKCGVYTANHYPKTEVAGQYTISYYVVGSLHQYVDEFTY